MNEKYYYNGSLIQMNSYTKDNILTNPTLTITDSTFLDNYFIGPATSLINVNNVLVTVARNIFINNGYLSTTNLTSTYTSL